MPKSPEESETEEHERNGNGNAESHDILKKVTRTFWMTTRNKVSQSKLNLSSLQTIQNKVEINKTSYDHSKEEAPQHETTKPKKYLSPYFKVPPTQIMITSKLLVWKYQSPILNPLTKPCHTR